MKHHQLWATIAILQDRNLANYSVTEWRISHHWLCIKNPEEKFNCLSFAVFMTNSFYQEWVYSVGKSRDLFLLCVRIAYLFAFLADYYY